MKKVHNLVVGATAEEIKIQIGSACNGDNDDANMEVPGACFLACLGVTIKGPEVRKHVRTL